MKKREAKADDKALQKANSANEVQRAGRADVPKNSPAFREELASINEELCQVTGVKAVEVANQIVSQMRAMQVSRFPPLASVHSLRLTLPPPEIKLRGGIRITWCYAPTLSTAR